MFDAANFPHDELPESFFQTQHASPAALSEASGMGVVRASGLGAASGWLVSPRYYGVEWFALSQVPVLFATEQPPVEVITVTLRPRDGV
jgi:hypothetical protein